MHRTLRRFVTAIASLLAIVVLYPVTSEFFIELAREHDLYKEPSQKVAAAMTAFNSFVRQPWCTHLAVFFVGLAVGLWIDLVSRKRELAAHDQDTSAISATQTASDGTAVRASIKPLDNQPDDANTSDATLVNLLRIHATSDTNVSIGFMTAGYKPLAMRLVALFELAGWSATISPPCPLEDVRHEYVGGIQVIGRNLSLTEHVANSLREFGFKTVSISVLPPVPKEERPDSLVRRKQQHINIKIGYH